MKATQRLYLNSDLDALVAAGDDRAAILYAAVGDEIPQSAADKFGLVEGRLPGAPDETAIDGAILRVATIDGTTVDIARLVITGAFSDFRSGQIDEGQLLELLGNDALKVEARIDGATDDWIEFPGRAEAIEYLKERVAADIEAGRAHQLVATRVPDDATPKPAPAAPKRTAATKAAAPKPTAAKPAKGKAAAKEAAPRENKEDKGGSDKEKTGGDNKGAGEAAPGQAAGETAAPEQPAA